jgi:hypothetical protein
MCTVSFLPKSRGFYLAMNRDEKRTRVVAFPPAIFEERQTRIISPHESGGGTWIAANDAGVCLALVNWHAIKREPRHDVASRGLVVRTLAGEFSSDGVAAGLRALPLRRMRPFRLIAIISPEKSVTEWRWDLHRLRRYEHAWEIRHWFSSGFAEGKASEQRAHVCAAARKADSTGSLAWLRSIHTSHLPKRGPFSVCMHRADAATVSYTEVAVSEIRTTMRYTPGPPCSGARSITKTIPRRLFRSSGQADRALRARR